MRYPVDFLDIHSKKPLCGQLAVAICANVSLEVAERVLRKHMPKHRSRWTGTTYHEQRVAALHDLGLNPVDHKFGRMTLQRLIFDHLDPFRMYMVNVTGHVVIVNNQEIIDQSQYSTVQNHWAKRKFIIDVTEV